MIKSEAVRDRRGVKLLLGNHLEQHAKRVHTYPAAYQARGHRIVLNPQVIHGEFHRADMHAHAFVAEDAARRHLGRIALESMQIRATDRGGRHLDDAVRWVPDLRIRHLFPGLLPGP